MTSDLAIDLSNVTVAYRSYTQRPTSLKESLIRIVKTKQTSSYKMFKALDNVSFTVPKGEVIGFIGSNGSGKSTLLKVLAGVLVPTAGQTIRNGSIASLIELGAGFDPELTGTENIFLNGALHRKTRAQIDKKVEAIIEFAELKDFADTPVKYYSSGMYARLGFSVAIDIDPDILLVDEILGVGDERFQNKCNGVFQSFIKKGKTIVIVSHNMAMLAEQASRVGLLSKGHLIYLGDPEKAIGMYKDANYETALAA